MRARLLDLIDLLRELPDVHRASSLLEVSEARSDTGPALWLAESVVVRNRNLDEVSQEIRDTSWIDHVALRLVEAETIGVISMGRSTRAVIESTAGMRAEVPLVRVPSSALARGLDDLGAITEVGDPATATLCLIPVAAWSGQALWTTERGVECLAATGASPVPLLDPIAELTAWSAPRYRPPAWLRFVTYPD